MCRQTVNTKETLKGYSEGEVPRNRRSGGLGRLVSEKGHGRVEVNVYGKGEDLIEIGQRLIILLHRIRFYKDSRRVNLSCPG